MRCEVFVESDEGSFVTHLVTIATQGGELPNEGGTPINSYVMTILSLGTNIYITIQNYMQPEAKNTLKKSTCHLAPTPHGHHRDTMCCTN